MKLRSAVIILIIAVVAIVGLVNMTGCKKEPRDVVRADHVEPDSVGVKLFRVAGTDVCFMLLYSRHFYTSTQTVACADIGTAPYVEVRP